MWALSGGRWRIAGCCWRSEGGAPSEPADGASAPQRTPRLDRSQDRDYVSHMTNVSVSELKAHLSRYLREVRRGGEVRVLDRGVPVAVLRPVAGDEEGSDERRERLIRNGVIRAGDKTIDPLASSPLKIGTSLLESLEEEREDRL